MRLMLPLALAVGLIAAPAWAAPAEDIVAVVDLPTNYHRAGLITGAADQASAPAEPADELWWSAFHDQVLDRLVEQAIHGNLDLEAARARLQQASGGLRIARSALAPSATIGGSGGEKRQSLNEPFAQVASRAPGFERTQEQFGLTVASAWELDLFGRLRAARRAASADADAAAASLAAARLTIAAEVTVAYLDARELQRRLVIAHARARTAEDLDRIIALRAAEGEASQAEADLARASLASARAAVPVLQHALDAAYDRIDVLVGRPPGPAAMQLGEGSLPATSPALDAALAPAALLRRRPDLVVAERQARAADARVAAAIADAYAPRVTLSALLGAIAPGVSGLLDADAAQRAVAGTLSGRLLDFGAARGQTEIARGRAREAGALYRLAVLRALQDVEGGLSARASRGRQEQQLAIGVSSLTHARDLTLSAYRDGAVSRVEALQAEARLLESQDAEVAAKAETARAAVFLYRALGGGWSGRPADVS